MPAILIILRNNEDKEFLINLLPSSTHRLIWADNTSQVLKIITQEKDIKLIIGNLLFNESGDYLLIKTLKNDRLLKHMPLIYFSADDSVSEAYRLAQALGHFSNTINQQMPAEQILEIINDSLQINTIMPQQEDQENRTSQRVARLALTAQLCSIREMVSILAHELSPPLMVCGTYVSACIRRLRNDSYDKEQIIAALQKANEHIEIGGKLLHGMKNSIRKTESRYEKLDIHQLIKRAISLIIPDPNYPSIQFHYDFDENLPLIEVDMTKIKLVILNLLNNGIEAMQEVNINDPELFIETHRDGENKIAFSIKDKGKGIDRDIEKELFNTCFTTKTKGLGMGLATCRGIVDDHHGSISFLSTPAGGACFKVSLPITRQLI
jgi:C4-dicarboxylate-specific signal transduction histidine kinase